MSLKRVLVVNKTLSPLGVEFLQSQSTKVQTTVLPYNCDEADIVPAIEASLQQGFEGLIWNTRHKLTKKLIQLAGPKLQAVSTVSSGIDHVDVEELASRGIPLGCSRSAIAEPVADIAVGLLISAARRFKEGTEQINSGNWKLGIQLSLGQEITSSTVGIVGLGSIGTAVARRLQGFRVARFLYAGRKDKQEAKDFGAKRVPLEELLRESDFVVLCCPLTEETKNLINADRLKLMKKNCVLVNVARGGLVDHEGLYEALKEMRIFAAGLDVVVPEPMPKDHKLLQLPNCFVIPHMGTATFKTRGEMAKIAARNVLLALDGKPMECPGTV